MEHVCDRKLDIVFLVESWMTAHTNQITSAIKDYGYTFRHIPRKDRKGGGVGFLIKMGLRTNIIKVEDTFTSFEHFVINVPCFSGQKIFLVVVYRLQEIKNVHLSNRNEQITHIHILIK